MRLAAGADWAFVSDASALVVVEEREPASSDSPLPRLRVQLVDEVRNDGCPRDPVDVARRFADTLRRLGVSSLASDAHYRASWQGVLADHGVDWVPAPTRPDDIAGTYLMLRVLLHSDRLDLPPSPRLRRQIADIQAKAGSGTILVQSRRRRDGDGGTSHGDIVSALVLAIWQLTRGASDYTHAGVRARSAVMDPRTRTERPEASQAGIERGEYRDLPPDD